MTLESRLDMPTEETTLLQEEASVQKSGKKTALCAFAALALVASSGSAKAIPESMSELMAGLPVWSFLLVLLLKTVRGIVDPGFQVGDALLLYAFALPYAIMNKACDAQSGDWGARIAQLGVTVGIVATVLDHLRGKGDANGFLGVGRFINAAAAGMLAVGTAKVVLTRIDQPGEKLLDVFMNALPFLGWMVTSVLGVYNITFQTLGVRGAGQSNWLLILYTAAELSAGSTSGNDLNSMCLKWSCIVGAAWAVCNALSINDFIEDVAVAAVMCAIFMPLAYKTMTQTELSVDAIMKNIVSFTFAALLGVHAILSLLAGIGIDKFSNVGSGSFLGIFALCFVVKHKELIAASGEATSFAKYADMLSQYGPAVALVLLVLSFVKLCVDAEIILKLISVGISVSELMMILGILLGS
jgi:hypothetical protein